jgi:hypothetical protein
MKPKKKRKTGSGAERRAVRPRLSPRRELGALFRTPAAWLALCCVMALPLFAKEKKPITKTVQGEVLDASNNPIIGASVELTDETAGTTVGVYTENGGRYQFTDLKLNHDYKVQAKYKGQASEIRHASSLDDRGIVVLNLSIPPPSSP